MTPLTNERQVRGLAIAKMRGDMIKRVDGRTFTVPSSRTALRYHVTLGARGMECDCPDFLNRTVTCKHQFAVLERLLVMTAGPRAKEHSQICGGCGADMDREECDYAKHEETHAAAVERSRKRAD